MNNINIPTELCAEDRARIDRLITALEGLTIGIATVGTPFPVLSVDLAHEPSYVNNRCPGGGPAEAPAEPETAPEPVAEVGAPDDEPEVKEVPEHTKAELQQKVVSLVSAGKKEEVKEIIKQYAPKVSEVPAEKINEVWDKLTELEG